MQLLWAEWELKTRGMTLNAKWAWVADTQGFALLLLLCQRAADGRRAESSFGKAELFWSSCDGLSSSGLGWAGLELVLEPNP